MAGKQAILIAGPTASGKSDLAVKLAQRLGREGRHGVIINADSQQVYRDLRILSARPTEDEMGGIEHRLFGTWDGAEPCSAANWADAAKAAIEEAHAAGSVPILCGGTGLYMRVLLEGIAAVTSRQREGSGHQQCGGDDEAVHGNSRSKSKKRIRKNNLHIPAHEVKAFKNP